jgi:signal peptidase I
MMSAQDQIARPQPSFPRWLRILAVGRNPKVTLIRAAVLVVSCFVVFKFILLPIRVEGISMLPTYQDRSAHLVNRLAYLWHEPRRGDVVSLRLYSEATNAPSGMKEVADWLKGPHVLLLKRIIGLPGDTVAFAGGHVLINGRVLDEPYEKAECDWNLPPVQVGPREYFVVGDNRTMPPQDHVHGRASRDQVVGKVIL